MNIFDDIINGKYNLVIITIMIIFIIHLYLRPNVTENMTGTEDQIRTIVNQVYGADTEAIQNLSNFARKLLNDPAYAVPASLNVLGKVKENGSDLVPRGTIVSWYAGSDVTPPTPPAGWALCDGGNGTPDLRGRFIRMYSESTDETGWGAYFRGINTSSAAPEILGISRGDHRSIIISNLRIGNTGGTDHQVLDVREMPAHNHSGVQNQVDCRDGHFSGKNGCWMAGPMFGRNTDNAGDSWGHNNIPPYYVLAYIMKL